MSHLKTGDAFEDFVGPLGCPSELISKDIEELKKMNIVFIAGGLGTAPVYPQVSASVQEVLENSVLTDKDAKTELDKSVERINAKLKRYVMKIMKKRTESIMGMDVFWTGTCVTYDIFIPSQ